MLEAAKQSVKEKYGNFWGEVFESREHFLSEYMVEDYLAIAHEWEEFGVTLIEVFDNNHGCEIVILNLQPQP